MYWIKKRPACAGPFAAVRARFSAAALALPVAIAPGVALAIAAGVVRGGHARSVSARSVHDTLAVRARGITVRDDTGRATRCGHHALARRVGRVAVRIGAGADGSDYAGRRAALASR